MTVDVYWRVLDEHRLHDQNVPIDCCTVWLMRGSLPIVQVPANCAVQISLKMYSFDVWVLFFYFYKKFPAIRSKLRKIERLHLHTLANSKQDGICGRSVRCGKSWPEKKRSIHCHILIWRFTKRYYLFLYQSMFELQYYNLLPSASTDFICSEAKWHRTGDAYRHPHMQANAGHACQLLLALQYNKKKKKTISLSATQQTYKMKICLLIEWRIINKCENICFVPFLLLLSMVQSTRTCVPGW